MSGGAGTSRAAKDAQGRYIDPGWSPRDAITTPLPAVEAERIEATLAAFVATARDRVASGIRLVEPTGNGGPDDIEALDYIDYEGIHEMFADSHAGYVRLAAVILGNCLRRMRGLQWCLAELPAGPSLAVRVAGDRPGVTLPLEALVVARLSGPPQHGGMHCLFFDLVVSHLWGQLPDELDAAGWFLDSGMETSSLGFAVPADVRERFEALRLVDRGRATRELGFAAFSAGAHPDWDALRRNLAHLERNFAQDSGHERLPHAAAIHNKAHRPDDAR